MAALNTTTFAYALKRLYSKDKIQTLTYQDNPFFAMVKKDTGFGGANLQIPLIYGDSLSRNVSFTIGQAQKAGSLGVCFSLTRVKDYSFALT